MTNEDTLLDSTNLKPELIRAACLEIEASAQGVGEFQERINRVLHRVRVFASEYAPAVSSFQSWGSKGVAFKAML